MPAGRIPAGRGSLAARRAAGRHREVGPCTAAAARRLRLQGSRRRRRCAFGILSAGSGNKGREVQISRHIQWTQRCADNVKYKNCANRASNERLVID